MPETPKFSVEEELASTTWPEDLPEEEVPLPETFLMAGDYVRALKVVQSPPGVDNTAMTVSFYATGFEGTKVYGAPEEIFSGGAVDQADGWDILLMSRSNVFPDVLTQINATLHSGEVVPIMGMGRFWSNTRTGQPVPLDTVKSYVMQDGSLPDFSQYSSPVDEPQPSQFIPSPDPGAQTTP